MIKWRDGKGGFVGGLKHSIKGFFTYQHSSTSATPEPAIKLGREMIAEYNDRTMVSSYQDRNMNANG